MRLKPTGIPRVFDLMTTKSLRRWGGRTLALCLGVAVLLAAGSARGQDRTAGLMAGFSVPQPRFGLTAQVESEPGLAAVGEPVEQPLRASGPSPALAGFMSAMIPGTGQLAQGQERGWLYLGIEAVAWFSFFALRNNGAQAEDDFQEFGDEHWTFARYDSVPGCANEEERERLQDLYDNSRDEFYEDIGRDDVYACGWDDAVNRDAFRSVQDKSSDYYRTSRFVAGLAVVNHLVSAIDAAKSASNRRKNERLQSLDWRVAPTRGGYLALRVELNRRF
jgi:hypothetical protein